ncbi:4Fe-4S dicluster domain-containing protein [Hoeflea sp. TYP-13]|uniref:4Fe-4S dicluster domain-containing protein n=1 Tax=Hoeflea sp. TYP-13 TaxID=3230023 RepID=UPI0034C6A9F0
MAKPNPHRPFTPDPAQMECAPDISGNTVNGLGESEFRRPSIVYWSPDPDDIPHGGLQRWFYTVNPDEPAIVAQRAERQKILDAPLPDLAGRRSERTPEQWNDALQQYVTAGLCEQVGATPLDRDWLFEGQDTPFANIIIVGVQHDFETISAAPEPSAGAEVMRQYSRAAFAAKAIAGWLRRAGWDADPVTGPMAGKITLIPPALACGFGELGKHGSLITPEMGASFRLSAVLTDAPFLATSSKEHGIDSFCANCRVCEDACPPEAIFSEKQTVRGETKWYVDFDKCLPFFNQTHGCAICIAACPWSKPGIGLNLAEKLARRDKRISGEGGEA